PPPPTLPPSAPASAAALVAPIAAGGPAPPLPGQQAGVTTAPQPAVAGGPAAVRPGDPASLQPQAPKRPNKVIEKTKPTRRLQPGDLVCGDCGEGNAPVRKFCSRCGSSLAQAAVVKKKWWQKIFPAKKQKVLEAGERPGRGGVKKKKKLSLKPVLRIARPVIGGLLLLGGILYAVYAPFRGFVNERVTSIKDSALDIVQQDPVPVRPNQVSSPNVPEPPLTTGCNDATGNIACKSVDQLTNTFWEFPVPQPGVLEPTLTVQFDRRVNIDRMIVHNGAGDQFTAFARPEELHLVFLPSNESFDVVLRDTPDPEEYSVEGGQDVTSIQIQIRTAFTSTAGTNAALSEIEFFQLD
ncbi:MAG: NADase-type glycan-binding domain-containing protein, partial [Acidimicrobiales bacterium]